MPPAPTRSIASQAVELARRPMEIKVKRLFINERIRAAFPGNILLESRNPPRMGRHVRPVQARAYTCTGPRNKLARPAHRSASGSGGARRTARDRLGLLGEAPSESGTASSVDVLRLPVPVHVRVMRWMDHA